MKNRLLVRFVFGALLALVPAFVSGGPWDPNRARPPGFQRTLSYLEGDLYNYPSGSLQQSRNTILHEDLTTTVIPQLKNMFPPSAWEAEGQKAYDAYAAQYQQLKTIIRQTMTDPDGLIQAVEGNRPLPAELLAHPNAQGLILLKWQLLNVAEQTYQALLYANVRGTGNGGSSGLPPDVTPPKPGKGKPGIDLERMREARRQAIERRRAFEARAAKEAAQRQSILDELLKRLLALPQSRNKFQTPPAGSYGALPETPTESPAIESATASEPPPTIEKIQELEGQIAEAEEKQQTEEPAAAKKPTEKVTVYRGTLILRRPSGLNDENWNLIKEAVKKDLAGPPGTTDMEDKGDEVTWRYKLLQPGGYPYKLSWLEDVPDAATTEEDATRDGKPEQPTPKKKEFEGNGPLPSEQGIEVPGSGPKFAPPPPNKFASNPKTEPAKPEPAKAAAVPGYWYDPTDAEAKGSNPIIYIRVDGVATRVYLEDAKGYGVPENATVDTMTWYSERTGKIVPGKNRGTQNSKP